MSEIVFVFFFFGGGPGDQLCGVRPLAACFGRVLDSNLGNQTYDSRTPSFWAFLLSKKGIKNCIQGKTTISQAQLSACFLCSHANPLFLFLTPPINKQTQIVMFGNFKLVSSIFNWSRYPLEDNLRIKIPFEGFILMLKTDWLGIVYHSRPWRWFHFLSST